MSPLDREEFSSSSQGGGAGHRVLLPKNLDQLPRSNVEGITLGQPLLFNWRPWIGHNVLLGNLF